MDFADKMTLINIINIPSSLDKLAKSIENVNERSLLILEQMHKEISNYIEMNEERTKMNEERYTKEMSEIIKTNKYLESLMTSMATHFNVQNI